MCHQLWVNHCCNGWRIWDRCTILITNTIADRRLTSAFDPWSSRQPLCDTGHGQMKLTSCIPTALLHRLSSPQNVFISASVILTYLEWGLTFWLNILIFGNSICLTLCFRDIKGAVSKFVTKPGITFKNTVKCGSSSPQLSFQIQEEHQWATEASDKSYINVLDWIIRD